MSRVKMNALVKEYPGGVRGVDEVDLVINDGEFFALLGPSGCGKTTLLRSIAGLEEITEGDLYLDERDVTDDEPGERGVAMVFQDYALFPHMSVSDNISYPLKIRKVGKAERAEVAEKVAGSLSLGGLLERRPGQLSGGQQQRVALARAVGTEPTVLLLDEPLSNLDARLRLEARTFLKQLQRDLGITTVFVTHDQAEALALADRIAVMKLGKLQQVGSPQEVFQHPANTFVAGFIGSQPMNLLPAHIKNGAVWVGDVQVANDAADYGLKDGTQVIWGIRPEYLTWSATQTPGAFPVRCLVAESMGASSLVTSSLGEDASISVVVDEDSVPEPDTEGWLSSRPGRSLLFDPETTLAIHRQA